MTESGEQRRKFVKSKRAKQSNNSGDLGKHFKLCIILAIQFKKICKYISTKILILLLPFIVDIYVLELTFQSIFIVKLKSLKLKRDTNKNACSLLL